MNRAIYRYAGRSKVNRHNAPIKCDWCQEPQDGIWRNLVLKDFLDCSRDLSSIRHNFFHEECFQKCWDYCVEEGLLW